MLQPTMLELRDDRTESYLRFIREHLNPQTQVVVVIFPTSRDDRYSAVKKLCCVESPVPSQVTLYSYISCRSSPSCCHLGQNQGHLCVFFWHLSMYFLSFYTISFCPLMPTTVLFLFCVFSFLFFLFPFTVG